MKKFSVIVALGVIVLLLLAGCQQKKITIGRDEATIRFQQYQDARDIDACWALIDSVEQAGIWPPEMIHYHRSIVYYNWDDPAAVEDELRKGIEAGKKNLVSHSYFIANYMQLASDLRSNGDYEEAMNVAAEALDYIEAWDKEGVETHLDPTAILSLKLTIGQTQARMGNIEGARKTFEEVWEMQQDLMERLPVEDYNYFFTEISLGILSACSDSEYYEDLLQWLDPYDQVFEQCSQYMDSLGVTYYEPIRLIYEVIALANTGHVQQADALYSKFADLPRSDDPGNMGFRIKALRSLGRYKEAARYYEEYMDSLKDLLVDASPDLLAHNYAVGYTLFRKSGEDAKAFAMGDSLAAYADVAMDFIRQSNSAELATIYDTKGKETQIALQKAHLSQQRLIGTGIALVLLTAFFLIYTWYRRRAQRRLAVAHSQLQEAYDQLEETTAAKERIESELRIARDIQMSMVPGIFPEYEGLDMYAEMTPAKEVGGDLYGYVLQGDNLYFCVGDVSGKGVPASLFMAQSSRLFRTLAAESLMPADIAVRMNNALAENNEQNMFVTMFIGLLHLDSGRLDFCNCGHNAPVFDGQFLAMDHINQPLGILEGMPFGGETIPDIRGRQLLIYTDGLNEAENARNELLGNERLLSLMSSATPLTSRETIAMLKAAVEKHRAGADPNDDLTLMCLRLSK
jgi:serine phosphatase RsbU (regulator of sigma subunit)